MEVEKSLWFLETFLKIRFSERRLFVSYDAYKYKPSNKARDCHFPADLPTSCVIIQYCHLQRNRMFISLVVALKFQTSRN